MIKNKKSYFAMNRNKIIGKTRMVIIFCKSLKHITNKEGNY